MDGLISTLQVCSLFNNKSPDEIDYLLSNIIYRIGSFKESETVFSHDQIADTMGIVLSGSVDAQKIFPSGKIVMIIRKTSPNLIAESSIFSKVEHYPTSFSACKPCKILFIHRNELLKLFSVDKDIMFNFIESVSNSTLVLEREIGILSQNSIQEKIVGYLFHECQNIDKPTVITLPFSKTTWAEHMNVSRTSLSRELKKMEIDGIISLTKGKIRIDDLERLKSLHLRI